MSAVCYRWDPGEAMSEDSASRTTRGAQERRRLRLFAARVALPEGRRRDGNHPAARRAGDRIIA